MTTTFPPLHRNLRFSILLGAQGLSITGREIGTIVLPLLVLALTESALHAGMIAAAQSVPYLLFSLPAGAIVDRLNRRTVMLISEYVRAFALLTVPAAWYLFDLYLLHLYVVAFTTGVAFVFYNVAEIALIPQLVAKEQLPKAMAATGVVEWSSELAGPLLGGLLVGVARTTVIGAMLAYLVQGAMQLISSVGLSFMRVEPVEVEPENRDLRGEMNAGIRWLSEHQMVRSLALMAMASNLLFAPVMITIIVIATDIYESPPEMVGLIFTIGGVAGLISAVVAPKIAERFRVGHLLTFCVAMWAAGMGVMALATNLYMLMAGWVMVTATAGLYDVTSSSYRLRLIPDELQGRVNSVFRFTAFGIRPLALAAGGVLITAVGASAAMRFLALGMLAYALTVASSSVRQAV